VIHVAALIMGFSLIAPAGMYAASPVPPGAAPTKENVLAAEEELSRGMRTNDADTVHGRLDPDWAFVTANGDIGDGLREDFCAAIKSGDFVRTTYDVDLSSARVRLYGNIAVVTFNLSYAGSLRGKSFALMKQLQTDVWKWEDGTWKAIFTDETRVVEK